MKFPVCLLVIIFVSLSLACSDGGNTESEEVFIDDGYKTGVKEEIAIDDHSFEQKDVAASQQRGGSQEITRIAADGSRVTTMYDAFGNKTETRFFDGNRLLQLIAIRTSVEGEKQVSVFGQNGAVKELPTNILDKVLTAPANEIAAAAGIYDGRRETPQPSLVQSSQPPLQPMPSYKFPIQQSQIEAVPAETNEPETDEPATAETAKPEGKTASAPKSKSENPASKTPSDEQK